ncbi:MAG: YybH family protein [Nitrososphaeraceae archaeon]
MTIVGEIKEIIDRETKGWNDQDIDILMSIFHPDMIWPWPKTSQSHDPMDWIFELGRFDNERWRKNWKNLFEKYYLIHNNQVIKKIVISDEGDGAIAIVDVDTLWRNRDNGKDFYWYGRAGKIYTKLNGGKWKMISHIGLLEYED